MSRSNSVIIFLSLCAWIWSGCISSPYYQKEYALPQNSWSYQTKPDFKIDIKDTDQSYNLYFIVRHTEAYPYSNIWLWVYTKRPGDSTFKKSRVEIPLADPTGKWLGRGMGEIWEQRMPITDEGDKATLRKKGVWEIKLEQNMRVNPLPEVLQVGVRIEKNTNTTFK